jgi:hypothetical protein
MVKCRAILFGFLSWGIIDPCRAGNNETAHVITTPIFEEWDNGASNITVTLRVINADYAWEYANYTSDLNKRTGISTVVTAVKYGAKTIATVKQSIEILEFIAGLVKSKSEADSCTLTYGTDISGELFYGYAYKATTTGENCDTTAEKKTILSAVEKCATTLYKKGATVGCCTFHHGGTWHGHLQLSAMPNLYPAHTVTC